jgi:hypothetical protein
MINSIKIYNSRDYPVMEDRIGCWRSAPTVKSGDEKLPFHSGVGAVAGFISENSEFIVPLKGILMKILHAIVKRIPDFFVLPSTRLSTVSLGYKSGSLRQGFSICHFKAANGSTFYFGSCD